MKDKFIGCLIGGAIGDALGYPVEFMTLSQIKEFYGGNGITDLVLNSEHKALISDDTQMTLFTADGMIWAYLRCSERGIGSYAGSGVYQSYLRWLYTQTGEINDRYWLEKQPHEFEKHIVADDKSILEYKELFSNRAPGNTCISALRSGNMGMIDNPINNSKGCGGVMRVAPVGLFLHQDPEQAFRVGAEIAAITHGHATGYLAAGVFSAVIAEIINGKSTFESTMAAKKVLISYSGYIETLIAIENAIELASSDVNTQSAISQLGQGWIAEEALAIALYCALKETDFRKALIMSVNHDGDSDSTGSICGNILGAAYGRKAIPFEWIQNVELSEFIVNLSEKLFVLSQDTFHGS